MERALQFIGCECRRSVRHSSGKHLLLSYASNCQDTTRYTGVIIVTDKV